MTKYINYNFIENNEEFILNEIKLGKIFIYPTDTIYGIGCDATNSKSIEKIFDIKKRENKPLLVIVPSFNWIEKNCKINEEKLKLIKSKLPGPFSFVLNLINKNSISENLLCGKTSLGVRIPKCNFSKIVEKVNLPFITTSVNLSGEASAVSLDDISEDILNQVDYVIESDEKLLGTSSSIFDLRDDEVKQLR